MTAQATIRPEKTYQQKVNKDKVRKFFMGSKEKEGLVKLVVVYGLLIIIGFIYIYPILYMISQSFMSLDDLLDSSISWIPSGLNLSNFAQAGASMAFWSSFGKSIILALFPTLCSLVSCSIIGYGIASFEFPGRTLVLGITLVSWVLPSQIIMPSTYVMLSNLHLINTVWAFIIPALFGQGLNAPIFILIFWNFFVQTPKALKEAASIDGAGYFKQFFKISVPGAAPAYLTCALFCFVWYWNESYLTNMYVAGSGSFWTTLICKLSAFADNYSTFATTATTSVTSINESIKMAGTLLSILPLIIAYLFLQRYFVESIDRAGITGE